MAYKFGYKINDSATTRRKKFFPILIVGVIIVAYIIVTIFLPSPKITGTPETIVSAPTYTAKIVWGSGKQVAVGAEGYGIMETHRDQVSAPIASIAKTMLAYSVLLQKPIESGNQGPQITITSDDVNLYKDNLAQNGSVVPVQLGEKLTEYQLLQALLIPSGDNIADTLANWAFGSITNYLNYANQKAADLGLSNTHFADASGLSAQTVSSATDLVVLGEKIIAQPVLKDIVSQAQVTLPVAGTVKNYNTLIGQENINGIKTGNTNEAGGCFLFSATSNISGSDTTIVGAILGEASRNAALSDTKAFLDTNVRNFQIVTPVKQGEVVGSYKLPWGKEVKVVTKDDLKMFAANGEKINIEVNLENIAGTKNKGEKVGTITAKIGQETVTVDAVLDSKISKPPFIWKIFHP